MHKVHQTNQTLNFYKLKIKIAKKEEEEEKKKIEEKEMDKAASSIYLSYKLHVYISAF